METCSGRVLGLLAPRGSDTAGFGALRLAEGFEAAALAARRVPRGRRRATGGHGRVG